MATYRGIHNDVQQLTDINNARTKPSNFVRLEGPSQCSKDSRMNYRAVKAPKNIELIEGNAQTSPATEQAQEFPCCPNSYLLSSKIKEANGGDFSNYSIEQYWAQYQSSPDATSTSDESSTNSTLLTSTNSHISEEKRNTPISLQDDNLNNACDNQDSQLSEQPPNESLLDNSRYAKNALFRGLLHNKLISYEDLQLQRENIVDNYNDVERVSDVLANTNISTAENGTNSSNTVKRNAYLVPHDDDPDFYTHSLLATGKVDDDGVDYTLPRKGKKETVTPRQHFMRLAELDSMFVFRRPENHPSKSKSTIHLEKNSQP